MKPKAIKQCRVCSNKKLHYVGGLGKIAVNDFTKTPQNGLKWPLELVYCPQCTLLQLKHDPPSNLYKDHYWYESSINKVIVNDLKQIASYAKGKVFCDIGCNDGSLLSFVPKSMIRIGVEPAKNLWEKFTKHCDWPIGDYWSGLGREIKADVITAIAMMYDLTDPNQFISDVKKSLAKDGIFIAQLMTLHPMIENNDIGNICLVPTQKVLTQEGLKEIQYIKKGERVISHLGHSREVIKTFKNKFDGELIKIFPYGYNIPVLLTPEHPVLCFNRNKKTIVSIKAKDIQITDILIKPIYDDHTNDIRISKEFMKVVGYYLSEGFIHYAGEKRNKINVNFSFGISQKEKKLAEDCSECIKNLGYTATFYQNKAGNYIVKAYGQLARDLLNIFGSGALNKDIPLSIISSLNKERAEDLLVSYMKGDGYWYRDKNWRATTISANLAYKMSLIANRIGYTCAINECAKNPIGYIQGRKVHRYNEWDILVNTKPSNKTNKIWIDDEYQYLKIRKIEKEKYKGDVYNLEVDVDNTYLTEGFAVHNCHEHVEFYSYKSLVILYERNGLEIYKVETNNINGGSYRIFARHYKEGSIKFKEKEYTLKDFNGFFQKAEANKKILLGFLRDAKEGGQKVIGYSASTKANTLLQWYGITKKQVPFITEVNPHKIGKYTIGSKIPIIGGDKYKKADYLWVFPYGFLNNFIDKEVEWLQKGGRFVVSIPEFKII